MILEILPFCHFPMRAPRPAMASNIASKHYRATYRPTPDSKMTECSDAVLQYTKAIQVPFWKVLYNSVSTQTKNENNRIIKKITWRGVHLTSHVHRVFDVSVTLLLFYHSFLLFITNSFLKLGGWMYCDMSRRTRYFYHRCTLSWNIKWQEKGLCSLVTVSERYVTNKNLSPSTPLMHT